MKKLLLLFLITIGTNQTKADDFLYMTFTNTDGTEQSLSVDNLNITFANDNIMATTGDESITLPLADVAKMYFSNSKAEPTGINETASTEGKVIVYNTAGVRIGTFANASQAHSQLEKGIYIIRNNGKTYKMTVK